MHGCSVVGIPRPSGKSCAEKVIDVIDSFRRTDINYKPGFVRILGQILEVDTKSSLLVEIGFGLRAQLTVGAALPLSTVTIAVSR